MNEPSEYLGAAFNHLFWSLEVQRRSLAVCEMPLKPPCNTPTVATKGEVEGSMITLIDVIVLLAAYAGLSLGCAGLIRLLRALPQRERYEGATTKGR